MAPFEDVDNHPTLLVVRRDEKTVYPVPYRVWSTPSDKGLDSGIDLLAEPDPGTDAGPWLKGTAAEHRVWKKIFATREQAYTARKGITTDRNGIFFVDLQEVSEDGRMCTIRNVPEIGRTRGIQRVREVVEADHVFPLLRGRGVSAFAAVPVPHTGSCCPNAACTEIRACRRRPREPTGFCGASNQSSSGGPVTSDFNAGSPIGRSGARGLIPSALSKSFGRRCRGGGS